VADDGTVTITIGGAVDSSLTASAQAAKTSLGDLAEAGEVAGNTLGGGLSEGLKSTATAALRVAGGVEELGEKLSSNDIVGAASQVAAIAASFSELSLAAMGPVGAIAAAAGALAYFGERAVQAADDTAKIELSGLGTKGFVASKEQIDEYVDRLDALPDMSSEDANAVVEGFQTMANRSQASMEGLSAATKGWADATGQSLRQAGEQLREVFGDPFTASSEQFITNLRGRTDAELAAYEKAKQLGDVYGAQKAMLEALAGTIAAARGPLEAHSASVTTNWRNASMYLSVLLATYSPQLAQTVLNEQSAESWGKLAGGVGSAVTAFEKLPTTRIQLPTPNLDAYIGHLQTAASLVGETASQRTIDSALIEAATAKLRDQGNAEKTIVTNAKQARDILGSQAAEIAKFAAQGEKPAGGGAQSQGASRAREEADKIISIDKQTNEAVLAGQAQLNASRLALGQELLSAFVAQEQSLAQQKYDADKNAFEQEAATGKITHAELTAELALIDAQYANKKAEIDHQAAEKQREMDQTDLQDSISTAERKLSQDKAALETQFQSHDITAQQLHDLEVGLTQQTEAEILKRFDAENAGLVAGTEAYKKAMKDRQALVDKFTQDVAAENNKLTEEQSKSWQQMTSSIESAESSLVSDIFSKRQGLGKDLEQIGLQMLERQIEYYLKEYTEHAMMNLKKLVSDKATTQQSDAFALQSSVRQTTLTQTQQAAQIGAVTAGVAAQNAAQSAGKAAGMAQSVAMGSAQISNDAMVGASGAYSALASIPVVGPFLGAAAAAVTFAAIMGYDALTSAEGGQYSVPFDGQLTELHKNEMVLPASIAGAMRETFEGRGGAAPQLGSGSLNVTHNIQSIDTGGVERVMRNNIAQIARVARNYQRNQVRR
jgi:hypothetical protein